MALVGNGWADDGWPAKIDWVSNPWGWPTRFGLGDDCAKHPVDPEHPMVWVLYPPLSETLWDERLQMEYSR